MTQCKIEFSCASHCVSKNLTPRRMLKNSFLIAQIIRLNKSFQNIYDMLWEKWTVRPGKQKKTPEIMDNFLDRLTLEGAGGQTDDTRSPFKLPLKVLVLTVQTSQKTTFQLPKGRRLLTTLPRHRTDFRTGLIFSFRAPEVPFLE